MYLSLKFPIRPPTSFCPIIHGTPKSFPTDHILLMIRNGPVSSCYQAKSFRLDLGSIEFGSGLPNQTQKASFLMKQFLSTDRRAPDFTCYQLCFHTSWYVRIPQKGKYKHQQPVNNATTPRNSPTRSSIWIRFYQQVEEFGFAWYQNLKFPIRPVS